MSWYDEGSIANDSMMPKLQSTKWWGLRIVLIWWVQVWGLNHDIDSSEAQTRVCLTCASDMCSLLEDVYFDFHTLLLKRKGFWGFGVYYHFQNSLAFLKFIRWNAKRIQREVFFNDKQFKGDIISEDCGLLESTYIT